MQLYLQQKMTTNFLDFYLECFQKICIIFILLHYFQVLWIFWDNMWKSSGAIFTASNIFSTSWMSCTYWRKWWLQILKYNISEQSSMPVKRKTTYEFIYYLEYLHLSFFVLHWYLPQRLWLQMSSFRAKKPFIFFWCSLTYAVLVKQASNIAQLTKAKHLQSKHKALFNPLIKFNDAAFKCILPNCAF